MRKDITEFRIRRCITPNYSNRLKFHSLDDYRMGINLRISLIAIIAAMLLTGVTFVTLSGQMVEAKTKSYQLTVYLDNAFMPNHLPSFKVVVYDSDDKQILSEKVTPDFTNTHQMISPEPGYEIAYKSKRQSSQIKVCAQESSSENAKIKNSTTNVFQFNTIKQRLIGTL